jgi:hypothetical protein
MTVTELISLLDSYARTFPTATVKAQGWDDMGNLQDFALRGDVRLERDNVGMPTIVVR